MLSCCQLCSVTRQVSEQSQESCIRMIEWKEFDFHRWLVLLVAGKVQEDGRAGTRTTSEVGDCVWSCVCGPVMCHWLCVVLWCVIDCLWSCDVSVIVCGPTESGMAYRLRSDNLLHWTALSAIWKLITLLANSWPPSDCLQCLWFDMYSVLSTQRAIQIVMYICMYVQLTAVWNDAVALTIRSASWHVILCSYC